MKLTFLAILCLIGCISESSDNTTDYQKTEDIIVESPGELVDSSEMTNVDIGYNNLQLYGKLERKTNPVSTKELETTGCKDWSFKENDLNGLLKKMEKVDAVKWNMLCYEYPCYYEGKVRNEKTEYTITINSASYIKLYNQKETIIFIAKRKSSLFITPCDCCE